MPTDLLSSPAPPLAEANGEGPSNLPAAPGPLAPLQRFLFPAMTWEDFQAFCRAFPERHFRLTYDRGMLEIMATHRFHGWLAQLVYLIVIVLTEELRMPRASCGDMTCGREDLDRALQPDQCFYLTNESRVRGKRRLSFPEDPPPDLAIEVEVTRTVLDRLGVLAALGVPEVWRYDGQRLRVLQLGATGAFAEVPDSRYFPRVPLQALVDYLHQRLETVEETELLLGFRAWVRQRIAANWQAAAEPNPAPPTA